MTSSRTAYLKLKSKMNHSIYNIQNNTIGNQSAPVNITESYEEQLAIFFADISISIICCSLGTIANIFVLAILRKKGNQRTVFDLMIVSLSVADLLTCLSAYAYAVYQLVLYLLPQNTRGDTAASIIKSSLNIITSFLYLLSLVHVLLITFQRFCAIFWPIRYRQVMTKTLIKKIIATMWVFLLASYSVAKTFSDHKKENPINGVIIFALGGTFLSFYMMITVKICILLKKKQFHSKTEHRVLLNSFGVTISYFACFSPYAYLTLMREKFSAREYSLITAITLVNFVLDPLFYFYFSHWLNRRDENRRNNPS